MIKREVYDADTLAGHISTARSFDNIRVVFCNMGQGIPLCAHETCIERFEGAGSMIILLLYFTTFAIPVLALSDASVCTFITWKCVR